MRKLIEHTQENHLECDNPNCDFVLPAITLYQPWATWIMREWKLIETRTHARFSKLKGERILIHAGLSTDTSDLTVQNPYLTQKQIWQNPEEVINGFILGSVYVYDFKRLTAKDSQSALIDCSQVPRWGLFLKDIKPFKNPIPAKGSMGIWYYNLDSKEKVNRKKP
ncbi:MAG: hypothetical protein VYB44_07325 [Bacteroidota bacterium]|nr:hypothetical protein [Bacteroidota bacterium]